MGAVDLGLDEILLVDDDAAVADSSSGFRFYTQMMLQHSTVVFAERWSSVSWMPAFLVAADAAGVDVLVRCGDELIPANALQHPTVNDFERDGSNEEPEYVEAERLVHGPRGAYYDHPFDNFTRTAHMWTGVLLSKLRDGETVSAEDVALCMIAVKASREAFRHKRDNVVDMHGYLMTLAEVITERDRRSPNQK